MSRTPSRTALQMFDEAGLREFHWSAVLTAGMGFFTDAYDLFIIGTVTALLTPIWHLTLSQIVLLNATALAASAIGAVSFGALMDRLGRKRIYGLELLLLVVGALISAASPSFMWLVAGRIIVGLGVGGDYPTSAVIMAEYANRSRRGFLVTMVFAMQGIGLVAGPVIAAAFLASGLSHDLIWRLLLGLGTVPAASVFYLRRRISETPRFLVANGSVNEARTVVESLTGHMAAPDRGFERQSLLAAPYLSRLLGTAGTWFLIDVAFYGNGVSQQFILKHVLPHANILTTTLISGAIFLVAALPGYYVAAYFMDSLGRKTIQVVGFLVMALSYATLFAWPAAFADVPVFIGLYLVSFFFIEFGPNATTFLLPTEVFPTKIRGLGHGLSAAAGKVGAAIGVFFLPLILAKIGIAPTFGILGAVSLAGALLTILAVPEMKQRSLCLVERPAKLLAPGAQAS